MPTEPVQHFLTFWARNLLPHTFDVMLTSLTISIRVWDNQLFATWKPKPMTLPIQFVCGRLSTQDSTSFVGLCFKMAQSWKANHYMLSFEPHPTVVYTKSNATSCKKNQVVKLQCHGNSITEIPCLSCTSSSRFIFLSPGRLCKVFSPSQSACNMQSKYTYRV